MAISKRAVAVVLLVAVAGAAHAFDNPLSADGEWSNIKDLLRPGRARAAEPRRAKSESEDTFVMSVHFMVRPSQHGTFRDEWAKLYDKVKDEEGLVAFKLRKTVNDDIVFIGYGEWEDEDAFMKHLECDYVSDWHKKLSEIGVPYKMEPLEVIGRKEIETKAAAAAAVSADQFSNKRVYMHTKVYLAPSMADDFEDAWEKLADSLEDKEKGARRYALVRHSLENSVYTICGEWDDVRAFERHLKADYTRKHFLDFTRKNDIVWSAVQLHNEGGTED